MDSDTSLTGFKFKHKRFSKQLKLIKVIENDLSSLTSPIYRCPLCRRDIICISTFILHVAGHNSCEVTEDFQRQLVPRPEDQTSVNEFMSFFLPKLSNFHCDICTKNFTNKSLLNAHIKRHKSLQRYICESCGSSFKQKSGLREHISTIHTNTDRCLICDICAKRFKNLRSLREHLEILHLKQLRFQCFECGRNFGRKIDLKLHQRQHEEFKEFRCSTCGCQFTHRKRLKEHEKIHLIQKPHHCHLCTKSFAQLAGLNQHLKVHSTQPQFECEFCNQRFKHSSTFYSHRKEHFGQKKANICVECGRICPSRFSLYHHKRTHLNITFACYFCQKKFKWKESLRLHLAKHSTDNPKISITQL